MFTGLPLRWASVEPSNGKSLATVIDNEENFNFSMYVFVPTVIHKVQIFEKGSSEVVLVPRVSVLAMAQLS